MLSLLALHLLNVLFSVSTALSGVDLTHVGTSVIKWTFESKLAYQGYDGLVPYSLQLSFTNQSSSIGIGEGVDILVYTPFAVYYANGTGNIINIWDLNKGGKTTICKNSGLSISSITSSGCGTRGLRSQALCNRECTFDGFVNDISSKVKLSFDSPVHRVPLVYIGCKELIISISEGTLMVLNCDEIAFEDVPHGGNINVTIQRIIGI